MNNTSQNTYNNPEKFQNWNNDIVGNLTRISRVATGNCELQVIVPSVRLAMAVPERKDVAALICNLYQPQRISGQIMRGLMKVGICTKKLAAVAHPWKPDPASVPEVSWLIEAARTKSVGFLGCNPNHGLRCVLAGILPATGKPFVAKLGFDGASTSIIREYQVLQALHGKHPGILEPEGLETGSDWAMLRLPYLGSNSPKSITEPAVMALLESWRRDDLVRLSENTWAMNLINRVSSSAVPNGWHNRMMSQKIRSSVVHGDFAVWNLRHTQRELMAIDWEWGEKDALAGIDLIHGLRQKCYMVKKMKPSMAIMWMLNKLRSNQCADYLHDSGWAKSPTDLLTLGLLHSHFNAKNDSKDLLRYLDVRL